MTTTCKNLEQIGFVGNMTLLLHHVNYSHVLGGTYSLLYIYMKLLSFMCTLMFDTIKLFAIPIEVMQSRDMRRMCHHFGRIVVRS